MILQMNQNVLKNRIKEYIIQCIDQTLHYRSVLGPKSKFKVGYTPRSFQIYYDRYVYVNNPEVFNEVYDKIKYEPLEEKRKIILQSLTF